MSQENVKVIRDGLRAFNAGGDEGLAERFAEDVVMHHPPGWPEPGPSRGIEAVAGQFARLRTDMTRYRLTEEDVSGDGDRFVVKLRWEFEGASSGLPGVIEMSAAYWFQDGKIAELAFYFDHAEALEAVGLRE